ncbi:MAG: molybdopterin-dependent oxidoreductase [Anaerolineales bacterium]|nr:molybdopterin-dependent oxidoreductase [Anaerolineales bacterium]
MTSTRTDLKRGALLGAVTSLPVMVLAYLGDQLARLPFLPFDVFDWMARALPGDLITLGIDSIVAVITALNLGDTSSTAKLIEKSIALGQFAALGAVFGAILMLRQRRATSPPWSDGLLGGTLLWIGALAVEVSLGFPAPGVLASSIWLAVLLLGWGAFLDWSARRVLSAEPEEEGLARRGFLALVSGGAAVAALAGLGLSRLLQQEEQSTANLPAEAEMGETSGPAASPPEGVLEARIEPAPGTRPELTSNAEFYRIDINTSPPVVDAETWELTLDGLVRNPLTLSMQELLAYPATSQVLTMQCISNPIGGDLTSTSRWTGVPFHVLLEEAGVHRDAKEVYIESADGFYESVSLEVARDPRVLLVYAMNGVPLPVEHGFPLRIYIPNRYGMKQPKWITTMEVIDEEGPGYWVDRGWSEEAMARTTSVVDNAAVSARDPETGMVPVGGIAWSGDEGISKVEVQIDGGPWEEAQLRTPPLSPLSWVQWRYEWDAEGGAHTIRVRAYDGNGELQILEESGARPDGATGVHSFHTMV